MTEAKLRARLLTHLFRKGQTVENTNLIDLACSAGASLGAVRAALGSLERAGLVDARRLRLTLPGLALAAAFSDRAERAQSAPRHSGRSLPRAHRAA